jgi:3-hydroxybutyryl-CoA dehydrogenase
MKKVLVIGEKARIEEFKQLKLQHAEVTFHEFADVQDFAADMDEEDEEEDDIVFEDEEEFEPKTIPLFVSRDEEDEDEEGGLEDGMSDFQTDEYDIVFDLNFDDDLNSILPYMYNEGQVVIACAVKHSLAEMIGPWEAGMECKVFGMNAWPTFIDRPKLEVSMMYRADHMVLEATLKTLGLDYEAIDDQVGLVTPRVVSMIINEAAFVLGEGTAEVEAVDQAMKLGTNYPKGPFEWCDQIGADNVVELLDALHKTMGDGKYKVAPALRRQALHDRLFYPQN